MYPINRNLFSQYCGQFSNTAEENAAIDTFYLQLPEQSCAITEDTVDQLFPIFTNWLHDGSLRTNDGTPVIRLSLLKLCRLCVFGILLESPQFSDAIVDIIKRKKHTFTIFGQVAIEDAVNYAYGVPFLALRIAVIDYVILNSGPWIIDAFAWPSMAQKDMLDALFYRYKETASAVSRERNQPPAYSEVAPRL